jgi:hypothetical protein
MKPMMDTLRRFFLGSREHPYTYLLIAILLLLFVTPPFTAAFGIPWLDDYLIIVVLIAALNNVAAKRHHVMIAVILSLPVIALRIFGAHAQELSRLELAVVIAPTMVFFTYLVGHILNDVLRGRRLTAEKIIGAIVAYLLIGLTWSLAYMLVEVVVPGSFHLPEDVVAQLMSSPRESLWSIFVYYSFVTLTTLGYGDITPVGTVARTLSWMESVVGPLYLAILVARLVGIQVAEGRDRNSGG